MLITQRESIRHLRLRTGRSFAACKTAVLNAPKVKDGCRDKLHIEDVRRLVANLSAAAPIKDAGIKPVSERHLRSIRATAQTEQIVNKLNTRLNAA